MLGRRRVRFDSSDPPLEHQRRLGRGLCDLLSDYPIGCSCMLKQVPDSASDLPLWTATELGPSQIADRKFTSVSDLLSRDAPFSEELKLSLMVVLARHLLRLPAGFPFSRWNRFKYDIFFPVVSDIDGEIDIDLENPFMGVDQASSQLNTPQNERLNDWFHSHPFMLELGILLLEIQNGQSIEDLSDQNNAGEPQDRHPYDDYMTAWTVIEHPGFENTVGKMRASAIRACLRCDFFPVDLPQGSEILFRLAHRHIVRPLELEKLLSDDEVPEVPDLEDEEDQDQLSDAETTTAAPVKFMSLPTDGSQKWRVFDEHPASSEQ